MRYPDKTYQFCSPPCIRAKILHFWHPHVSTTSTHLYVHFNANTFTFFHPHILLLLCGQHGINTQRLLGESNEPKCNTTKLSAPPSLDECPQTQAPHLRWYPLPSTSPLAFSLNEKQPRCVGTLVFFRLFQSINEFLHHGGFWLSSILIA